MDRKEDISPTAAAQKLEESPLTYLNKGQYYTMTLKDTDTSHPEQVVKSTIVIMFNDESHFKVANNYWRFWLSQQKNAKTARAIDIDNGRSAGVLNTECSLFDRITFEWNTKKGAMISIRFSCLSTDFSRIKGVKGIPLRLQMSTCVAEENYTEKSYCRIKLFRDKGAERKNKDDARHIERQLEKLRGKNGEPHPLWLTYSQTQPHSVFRKVVESSGEETKRRKAGKAEEEGDSGDGGGEEGERGGHLRMHSDSSVDSFKSINHRSTGGIITLPPPQHGLPMSPHSTKRVFQHPYAMQHPLFTDTHSSDRNRPLWFHPHPPTLDIDPEYVPHQRRRIASK
ncbi:CP2 transcription factor-domain-containing protein [Spinellus fusiger]|nr:CP2 transcription factor-domain-containing protein [Spinellus fusiger]